jgi:hypothetical protein
MLQLKRSKRMPQAMRKMRTLSLKILLQQSLKMAMMKPLMIAQLLMKLQQLQQL